MTDTIPLNALYWVIYREHARQSGFEQIELEVVSTNRRAIGLYVKYDFQVYGTRPHGIKYPDGSYADDYLMRKVL